MSIHSGTLRMSGTDADLLAAAETRVATSKGGRGGGGSPGPHKLLGARKDGYDLSERRNASRQAAWTAKLVGPLGLEPRLCGV